MSSFWSSKPSPIVEDTAFTGPLVSMCGVEKYFDTPAGKSYVLRRMTLDITPGEFITIMGPSGAGKSTLLSILGMFDGAWVGEYFYRGTPVHALPNKDRLTLNYGTLYPALLKLEQEGFVTAEWRQSENNRRAKFYSLTAAGRKQLAREAREWHQTTDLIAAFLAPRRVTP